MRWTLRAQLVALVLILLTTATLVIGTVTVLALHGSLVDQVDSQLMSASARTRTNAGDRAGPSEPPAGPPTGQGGPGFLNAPGTSEGTLGAVVADGAVVAAATIAQDGQGKPVSAAAAAALAKIAVTTTPRTYDLPDLGSYRVVASSRPGGEILVTGLPLAAAQATQNQLTLVIIAVGGIWLAVAGVAGSLIVRRTLRPLLDVAATAESVARLPLDRGEVALAVRVADDDPRTEVGQVGSAVNAMLGHVARALEARHASEERVRGFVADASHELRTPLASIRGYAELTRGSRDQVPPDVAKALERVESEAARMTVLVEDLLLLARLDAGRVVEHTSVDLTQLVIEALHGAQVAAPEHHWRLDLPDEPVIVHGDAQQLHQVVANLLSNARTHTPPGTTVTAALGCGATKDLASLSHLTGQTNQTNQTNQTGQTGQTNQDGQTGLGGQTELTELTELSELSVSDDGPGIPASVLPTVFERFVRAESSRSRAHGSTGSTGLGLAIVSSIVTAHGGTTEAASQPGRTTFTVRLPRPAPGEA